MGTSHLEMGQGEVKSIQIRLNLAKSNRKDICVKLLGFRLGLTVSDFIEPMWPVASNPVLRLTENDLRGHVRITHEPMKYTVEATTPI